MAPDGPRKRVKPNPGGDNSLNTEVSPTQVPLPADEPQGDRRASEPDESSTNKTSSTSWYGKTWPRKAAPVTQVARESISSTSNAVVETVSNTSQKVSTPKNNRTSSPKLAPGSLKSKRSLPAGATTTKVHATSELPPSMQKAISGNDDESNKNSAMGEVETKANVSEQKDNKNMVIDELGTEANSKDPVVPHISIDGATGDTATQPRNNSMWLGWFSRSEAELDKPPKIATSVTMPQESAQVPAEASKPAEAVPIPDKLKPDVAQTSKETLSAKRTWFQMWGGEQAQLSGESNTGSHANTLTERPSDNVEPAKLAKDHQALDTPKTHSKASSLETSLPPAGSGDHSKSAGWVFWSREKKPENSNASDPHVGELAVSDTPSQTQPKRASINLPDGERPKEMTPGKKTIPPQAKDPSAGQVSKKDAMPATPMSKVVEAKDAKQESPKPKDSSTNETAADKPASTSLTKAVPNLLLPSFQDTFAFQEHPSILQQLGRLLYYTKPSSPTHLHRTPDLPRIKTAIAIGVHGYFPAPLIRTVLGQPTGTSIKFADMAARAIRKWTGAQGYDCVVKTAALEGEGRIAERIDLLWKLLLNWIDELRRADFVLIAAHSQGVPVAVRLLARLIDFGVFTSPDVRVGICAMAGVNMGPFADYKSRLLSGSAGELFDFSNPRSAVSTAHVAALDTVLRFGTRITLLGSIDDQLVSLESALFTPLAHPGLFRAVFVDGRVHAPNFLVHLVGFALKLRNRSVADHGLIRELSGPLAGSLYGGEGHSRIYEDEAVYELAVRVALETGGEGRGVAVEGRERLMQLPVVGAMGGGNPYILPFAMRGVLEEEYVKGALSGEVEELLKQFDEWRPATKVLRDVKFRLEGVRSRL